ncbi:MAG: hypothetical protein U5L45_24675 [Saprospiraceae bacterium]|nr:hypothetical protein [Saprospiraceae bacterium]
MFLFWAKPKIETPFFCERSERGLSDYDRYKKRVKPCAPMYK